MVIKLRSTICLLLFGLIACPQISAEEEGFLFQSQQEDTGTATADYYRDVIPYVQQAQLPTLPTDIDAKPPAKPKAAETPKPQTPKPKAAKAPEPEAKPAPKATPAPKTTPAPPAAAKPKPAATAPAPPAAVKPAPAKAKPAQPAPAKTAPAKPIQPSKKILTETAIDYGCNVNDECCGTCCNQPSCCDPVCSGGCNTLGYDCYDDHDFFRSGNFYIRGWIDQGVTFNSKSPKDRLNGPTGYNWRSNEYLMNQLYTVIGRDVTANGCCWDAGGRVDALYGTDYIYTQATGLETRKIGNSERWNTHAPSGLPATYGFSLPQLYAEFAVPFAQGTTFKFGHFYSLVGYESPMAPQNFFYSHSYARVYGEPTTETGMLASSKISPNIVVHGGFSQGWNIWESPIQALSFIGGICWTSYDDRTSVGFAIDTGQYPTDARSIPAIGDDRTVGSLVISQQFGCRWTYIFQYDFGSQQNAWGNIQDQPQTANWYGINNYLFYSLSDTLSAGMRVEWFCDADRYIVFEAAGNPAFTGKNYCELTLGLNWQPNNCMIIRPEFRWDWSNVEGVPPNSYHPYNDYKSSHQFLFATDIIIRF
ncbi:MAG: porin [Pirellulales bacterium]|nr:porin [Pirellulales bacterium]